MYTLRLLGPPRLLGSAGPVSGRVAQERRLAFLAVLALADGRTLTRDSLAAMFWPESDEVRARHNVADGVWSIRSALGDEAIATQGSRLALNPEVVTTDVDGFQAALRARDLPRAVGAYRGPFMEGFHVSGAPDFELWLDRERTRLAAAQAGALEELVRDALGAGRLAEGAEWSRRLAAADPLNTGRALLRMEALAASGDLAGAVRHGEAHGALLAEELGIPPPPGVRERIRELRASPPPVPRVRVAPRTEVSRVLRGASRTTPGPFGRTWSRSVPLVAVAATLFLAWVVPARMTGDPPEVVPDRIVVAAFENRTGDPDLDLLGDLTADVLIRGLSRAEMGELILPIDMIGMGGSNDDGPRGPRQAQELARDLFAGISVSGTIDPAPEGAMLATTITVGPGQRGVFILTPEPVDPTDPVPALERVRSRVLGTLASHLGHALPEHPFVVPTPSYESYRSADRATALFLALRYQEAAELYRRAYELDSMAVGYLLWEGVSRHNLSDRLSVQAILSEVRPRRNELTPFDDAQFEWLESRLLGDMPRALRASQAARTIHPHSGVGGFQLGRELLRSGRPGEALEVLLGLDSDQGWLSRHLFYWTHVAEAYHLLGRYEEELAAAEEGYRRHRSSGLLTARLRALAALGRMPELERTLRESTNPASHALNAARALHRHGFSEDAVAVAEEGLRALASTPLQADAPPAVLRTRRDQEARLLMVAGHLNEARHVLLELLAERPRNRDLLGWAGFVEARLGLEAEARGRIELLDSLGRQPFTYGGHKVARAAIHAELGDDPALVRLLLEESHREGWPLNYFHFTPLFDPVREHPDVRDFFEIPRW